MKYRILVALVSLIGAVAAAPAPSPGAGQRYLEYKAAAERSKSIDDLIPFMTKEEAERTRNASDHVKENTWGSLRGTGGLLSRFKVVEETPQGAVTKLDVTATDAAGGDKTTRGTVEMVLEDGEWKVRRESWKIGAGEWTASPGVSAQE
jgi:hypothetical protein